MINPMIRRAPLYSDDGGTVQQLSVYEYYELGKAVDHAEKEIGKLDNTEELKAIAWTLFLTRWRFQTILTSPCALPTASQRAARSVCDAIGVFIPADIEETFNIKGNVHSYQLSSVSNAIKNFETVLKNDMPEMSTYAVAQIGIYRTDDLIKQAHLQVDETLRSTLLPLALKDVTEAGKCLAFRVPTAAAFHLSRAIETGMNQYYEALTGGPFDLKEAAKNWAIKTQALKDKGGDDKITEFLVHIRKAYRNPITHPDVILESGEAFGLFSQALSVIAMMLGAVKEEHTKRQPLLTGLVEAGDVLSLESAK